MAGAGQPEFGAPHGSPEQDCWRGRPHRGEPRAATLVRFAAQARTRGGARLDPALPAVQVALIFARDVAERPAAQPHSPAAKPWPGCSVTPSAGATGPAAATRARASGCRLCAASDAATQQRVSIGRRGPAPSRRFGQRAGLVEHDGVDLGQPLQRGGGFQQHAGAEQARGGDHLHRRHRQRQGAGAGDDQHRARGQQRLRQRRRPRRRYHPETSPARSDAPPARSGAPPGRPAPRSGRGGPPPPRSGGRIRPAACRPRRRSTRTVSGAPRFIVPANTAAPGRDRDRQALAGDQAGVERGLAAFHHAVDADPLAHADQHALASATSVLGRPSRRRCRRSPAPPRRWRAASAAVPRSPAPGRARGGPARGRSAGRTAA